MERPLIYVFAISIACQFDVESIKGGKLAQTGQFKYMVSITYHNKLICGGAIINEHNILTAGHCVHEKKIQDLGIVAGKLSSNPWFAKIYRIRCFKIHSDFQDFVKPRTSALISRAKNDIAILELEEPLKFTKKIDKIDLPKNNNFYCQTCNFAGWGAESEESEKIKKPSKNLKFTTFIPLTTEECCDLSLKHRETEFCAVNRVSGETFMQGDSGGPLVCNNTIAGIAMASSYFLDVPVIFVNVWKYLPFILDSIREENS